MRNRWLVLFVIGCAPSAEPDLDWPHYAASLGDPIAGLDAETLALYEQGREVMDRAFRSDEGLGPTFNADACSSCHQGPVSGGSSPRYRDFFLVKAERWDGALVNAGTNGTSPVRNLYSVYDGHIPVEGDIVVAARRNTPPGFGVGLFEFIDDSTLIDLSDPMDLDGDGISGRTNWEQGRVGRFGYKAQAAGMESFNRGAIINQMGITSNPLFYEFPETPPTTAAASFLMPTAFAQVSAPGEPTTDDDGVPDPEISDEDQLALLIFSTYIAPPRPAERTAETRAGAKHFDAVGCTSCHVPALPSSVGAIPAYTDLLLHDMGEDLADGIVAGFAESSEWRTAPLWGVALSAPYLHDGRAETLHEAIVAHGGEGAVSRDAYLALDAEKQEQVTAFLESLGGENLDGGFLDTAYHEQPGLGEAGGPVRELSADEQVLFDEGRRIFDRSVPTSEGLGSFFNADSCRACHQDPVLGGAGGADTNVVRFGRVDDEGTFHQIDGMNVLPRVVTPGGDYYELPSEANVVELRNPLTTLGIGLLDGIPDEDILALADPDDLDADGISGRARDLDGVLGRFGWKSQVPSLRDFVADAAIAELGLTVDTALSDFTVADDGDAFADPEFPTPDAEALEFWLANLAPPVRGPDASSDDAIEGEYLFEDVGCASCHVPEVGGVAAYTDLLLHDVAAPWSSLVDQEAGVAMGEFRTPPLWGVVDTAPYLHDGIAPTIEEAVRIGHYGEAESSRIAFEELSPAERLQLLTFLESL